MALVLTVAACGGDPVEPPAEKKAPAAEADARSSKPAPPTVARETLPAGIQWLTNDTDPVFASDRAVPGGSFHSAIMSFPMTFRSVGPDSNGVFAGQLRANQLSLIGLHPNTLHIIPELATHWAFGDDKKTMYFKLNPDARWSDGHPVTADDFAYTLTFMRSREIVAPWYNDYYAREIDRVIVYDDHTLAVVAAKPVPDLHLRITIGPTPEHFYGKLGDDFVRRYNWKIVPNTGPYQISDFQKGKSVIFTRKKDWWAAKMRYFRHRFNVDTVKFTVVRDFNLQWEYFKKAKLDAFGITLPSYWHVKSKTPVVENGYVHRIWFFNDTQQSAQGMWLNQDRPILKDPAARYAFAHAMNVEKVIGQVLRNDYFRLEHGFVGYGDYSNESIRARRFDLDRVRTYLTGAGWQRGPDGIWQKDGQRYSVEVTYSLEAHTPRLVVLKEEAKKAGIELRLQQMDSATAFKKFLEKKHDVAWMGWSTSMRPQFWEHFHSANAHKPQTNNITNTDDPELDRLIDAYRNSLAETERKELAIAIEAAIHETGCFVPTFMVPYVRIAYWRWWRLPESPGTKESGDLFDPFGSTAGGLFWFDPVLYEETRAAMKAGRSFDPVTRVDETHKMTVLKGP
ncbi:MAG: ABC transporter substrate-binding protein [Desulfobacterales bacterium]|nr:ABC transporter substrate-binding protein [Desulfobacterales bacterium]